jgi:hypothetical protein
MTADKPAQAASRPRIHHGDLHKIRELLANPTLTSGEVTGLYLGSELPDQPTKQIEPPTRKPLLRNRIRHRRF